MKNLAFLATAATLLLQIERAGYGSTAAAIRAELATGLLVPARMLAWAATFEPAIVRPANALYSLICDEGEGSEEFAAEDARRDAEFAA